MLVAVNIDSQYIDSLNDNGVVFFPIIPLLCIY